MYTLFFWFFFDFIYLECCDGNIVELINSTPIETTARGPTTSTFTTYAHFTTDGSTGHPTTTTSFPQTTFVSSSSSSSSSAAKVCLGNIPILREENHHKCSL